MLAAGITNAALLLQFNVTCGDSVWKLSFVGTLNSIGQFVGLPVMGAVSDR